jgi:hypothetical protein
MDGKCDYTFRGESDISEMGSSVAIIDLDNDGFSEVIVGSRIAARGRGRVYIYWGGKEFRAEEPNLTLEGLEAGVSGTLLGGDEIVGGHFNNDEYADILVGAMAYKDKVGAACMFYGNSRSLMDNQVDCLFEGEYGHTGRYGSGLSVGDINNDSYDDVVMEAWGYNNGQGRAYLYYGPFDTSADITFNWDTSNASIGTHTLKVEISPVEGEEGVVDNTKIVTVEVTEPIL